MQAGLVRATGTVLGWTEVVEGPGGQEATRSIIAQLYINLPWKLIRLDPLLQ